MRALALRDVPAEEAPLPVCECGALKRPGVVWFGEALDEAVVEEAWQVAERAEVLLVIGTSAVVFPVAGLPDRARRHGALVVEINPEPSALTSRADLVVRAGAGVALIALEHDL